MLESRRRYYFLEIAKYLNITKAAAALYISQPSLTQYLNQLEKELDAELIDRKYTPLRLTRAGQIYYDYLKEVQYREQVMQAMIAAETTGKALPIRIGVPMQKSRNIAETILTHFTDAYPSVSYSIWEGTTSSVRNCVVQGELDIGFGYMLPEEDPECEVIPLIKERVVIVCNRNNPVVSGREATLENPLQVAPEALEGQQSYEMGPGENVFLRGVEKKLTEQFGLKPSKRIVMSHLYSRISDLLSHPNTGYAFIPDYIFNEEFARSVLPQLAILRLGEEDYIWYCSMFRKKNTKPRKNTVLFWNCIREKIGVKSTKPAGFIGG